MTTFTLVVYVVLLAIGVVAVWVRPIVALYVFIVGLALHNLAMALLYDAGVHGNALDAVQAWKEVLLATAVARVAWEGVRPGACRSRRSAWTGSRSHSPWSSASMR